MKKTDSVKKFLMIAILLITLQTAYSQTEVLGCCTNPGAGLLSCTTERLAFRDKECCPKPESNFFGYYKSSQNPNGPSNYADCTSNYFIPNKDCATITACSVGCCCLEGSGSIKPESQCQGTGTKFYKGYTNCDHVCVTYQCSDGIDNDKNGCADLADTGCQSTDDNDESGGKCLETSVTCSNPSYVPKLSNFDIKAVRPEKKFLMTWDDECRANLVFYEVFRCEGEGCTTFESIGIINKNSFEDASDKIEFSKVYTYKIEAHYSLQDAVPSILKTATLGDKECSNRQPGKPFCFDSTPYSCNQDYKLVQSGAKCIQPQICIVRENKALCSGKPKCNKEEFNPFGLLPDIKKCEENSYCFYDRSYSIVNACFSCDSSMSCYDYKTEGACTTDNCKIGNCKWKQIGSAETLDVGVCVSTEQSNCQWCYNKGTESLENVRSYNEIFDLCTKEKSNALSEPNYKCYFKGVNSLKCRDIVCSDYDASQCSNAQITHDNLNNIANPSNDECGIQVCQNINNACTKNADGDDKPDCEDRECEKDYFPPNANLIPIVKKGLIDGILIQIYDRLEPNGSVFLQGSPNYLTFLCLEPCSSAGHPYTVKTNSRKLIVSGLTIYDVDNGDKLLSLKEGTNSILYYSEDPSKNLGRVESMQIQAYASQNPPKVLSVYILDTQELNDKIYTNSQQPTINVRFVEPAIITYARLVAADSGAIVQFNVGEQLSAEFQIPIQQVLKNGEYKLELNAKNDKGVFMDSMFTKKIVVDNINPKLEIIPSTGTLLNDSFVKVNLSFNEEVNLAYVAVNDQELTTKILSQLSTLDNKDFIGLINMSDGNKVIEVEAQDYAKNKVSGKTSFIVDAYPTRISLILPKFGVAADYVFDLGVETDNNQKCRFELDSDIEFDFMQRFKSTGGTLHITEQYDEILSPDTSVHKLYVKCSDKRYGITRKVFDLSVDNTEPDIINAFAYPNPVIEKPMTTRLTVETDDLSICKYSTNSQAVFEDMKGKFEGFEDNTFRTINRQQINLTEEGDYTYYVACRNKAGLVSEKNEINFTVTLTSAFTIISHTPELFNTTAAVLAIETNKKSQCKYSETDTTAQTGILFGPSGYGHTAQLNLSPGRHIFYIICKDQYLKQWSSPFKVNFSIDITSPVMLYVNDTSVEIFPPDKSCYTDRLRVKYLGEDMESGIKEYYYTILKGNQPVTRLLNSTTGGDWVWVENLILQDNTQYFFSVRAKNYVNLLSNQQFSDGVFIDPSLCGPGKRCGDGVINQPGEECDLNTFSVISSCLNYTNFADGTLRCTPPNSVNPCKLDTSNCTRIPNCNNGRLDPGESCDGNLFGKIDSCSKFNASFSGGTLKCTSKCELDTSSCTEKSKCGNNVIDLGENCDALNLGPLTGKCIDYASTFTDGNLTCTPPNSVNPCKLDTSKCQGVQGNCNNGVINIGEACDGNVFGQIISCTNFSNFIGGTLGCTSNCQLNTSGCIEKPKCGNTVIDLREHCDNITFVPQSGKCIDYSIDFSDGNLKCKSNCKLDTSECKSAPLCGNTRIDAGESCDTANFGALSGKCIDYSSNFQDGNLTCTGCNIDTSSCLGAQGPCGNGVINIGEQCDGNSFGTINSCLNYPGFISGTLRCANNCTLDTSGCSKAPTCGNNRLDTGELCDNNLFANLANLSCSNYRSTFYEGNLTCKNCEISTDNCKSNATVTPPISCRDRGTCKINESCSINADCESRFCINNKCRQATCDDDVQNQGEPSVDCGGPCDKCSNGKYCKFNSDCRSNFCNFGTCKEAESCIDGLLSPSEADVDCGGPCPAKCSEGRSCNFDSDCDSGLSCLSAQCKKLEDGGTKVPEGTDSDGDGLPDDWEVQNGLDPNNPNDADLDNDNDGLTNKEEYETQATYGTSTDPKKEDTDGDGHSDKREIDQGTDPLDPQSLPKSSFAKTLMFIIGAIVLIGGFGVLGYFAISRRRETEFEIPAARVPPRPIEPRFRQPQFKQPQFMPRLPPGPDIRSREAQKDLERKKVFEGFGGFGKEKEESKKQEVAIKTEKPEQKAELKEQKQTELPKKLQTKKKTPKAKKPKEDVFVKLKEIAQGQKKKQPERKKK